MLAFIRLLRPVNLGIIALTMYLLKWFIFAPILHKISFDGIHELEFQTTHYDFFLLVISTVFIGAAGNIINDYFDLRADRINKPEKVLIGKRIKRRQAMFAHLVLNSLAILIALYLSIKVHVWTILLVHLFSAGALWFYSLVLKRRFLVGNLIIAITTGLVPILVALFEIPPIIRSYESNLFGVIRSFMSGEDPEGTLYAMYYWAAAYGVFAFITTLIREIQKDLADKKGDQVVGCRTAPIAIGERNTKILIDFLILIFIAALAVCWAIFLKEMWSLIYIIVGILIPTIISAALTSYGIQRDQHLLGAKWMKITMLMGILFALLAGSLKPELILL